MAARIKIPKTCINCPLAKGLTRNCGQIEQKERSVSSGISAIKKPDGRCLLIGLEVPERLKKALIEYGTRF